jgi:hypothetical protein
LEPHCGYERKVEEIKLQDTRKLGWKQALVEGRGDE